MLIECVEITDGRYPPDVRTRKQNRSRRMR
jgi:hypothetical protein